MIKKLFGLTILAAAAMSCAQAAELTGTLKKVKETNSITVGYRESSIPFSYYDDKQQVIGYSQEFMLKAVEAIKANQKLAKLDVKLMPVTSAHRIAILKQRVILGAAGIELE